MSTGYDETKHFTGKVTPLEVAILFLHDMRNLLRESGKGNAALNVSETREHLVRMRNQVEKLTYEGLHTDGGHHKQWYLYQIAELLGIDLSDADPGVAP